MSPRNILKSFLPFFNYHVYGLVFILKCFFMHSYMRALTHRPIPCCAILGKKMWCYTGVRHSTDTKEMQEIFWEYTGVFKSFKSTVILIAVCYCCV